MPLREDVLTCLRERLMNQSGPGRIFESDEAYLAWLVGTEENEGKGFLADPAGAMSRNVTACETGSVHSGVELSPEEGEQIRRVFSGFDYHQLRSRFSSRSSAMLMAGVAFMGPLLSQSGGY